MITKLGNTLFNHNTYDPFSGHMLAVMDTLCTIHSEDDAQRFKAIVKRGLEWKWWAGLLLPDELVWVVQRLSMHWDFLSGIVARRENVHWVAVVRRKMRWFTGQSRTTGWRAETQIVTSYSQGLKNISELSMCPTMMHKVYIYHVASKMLM